MNVNLRTLRLLRGYRQADIARAIGIHATAVSRIENGSAGNGPAAQRAKREIAAMLGVPTLAVFPEVKEKADA